MTSVTLTVLAASLLLLLYTYLGYPLILWALGAATRRTLTSPGDDDAWPAVSISVPAYNEEGQIRGLIESLLALDYPRDRLQILIVSDASSDDTDAIVVEYADRGVELLRMPERGGKTKAETAAAAHLRGDIIVNTDASIRIQPDSLKHLLAAFRDPEVGLASGRDVSVSPGRTLENLSESGYVGYEMGIRDLETRVAGIIGASGCFYAILAPLHRVPLPDSLSRDFASALHTIEHGYRPVSVSAAVCHVPRTTSLRSEFRRKVRTITRGMETLWHKRQLLNPFRHSVFSWMLISHKLCRWALPWAALASFVSLAILAPSDGVAAVLFGLGVGVLVLAAIGWVSDGKAHLPKMLTLPAFVVAGNLAAAVALIRAFQGHRDPTWEPTRRAEAQPGTRSV